MFIFNYITHTWRFTGGINYFSINTRIKIFIIIMQFLPPGKRRLFLSVNIANIVFYSYELRLCGRHLFFVGIMVNGSIVHISI